jgi:hypothetical protein
VRKSAAQCQTFAVKKAKRLNLAGGGEMGTMAALFLGGGEGIAGIEKIEGIESGDFVDSFDWFAANRASRDCRKPHGTVGNLHCGHAGGEDENCGRSARSRV